MCPRRKEKHQWGFTTWNVDWGLLFLTRHRSLLGTRSPHHSYMLSYVPMCRAVILWPPETPSLDLNGTPSLWKAGDNPGNGMGSTPGNLGLYHLGDRTETRVKQDCSSVSLLGAGEQ